MNGLGFILGLVAGLCLCNAGWLYQSVQFHGGSEATLSIVASCVIGGACFMAGFILACVEDKPQ